MMLIEKVIIKNFRRYNDATFEFRNNSKNTSNIILARNGVGKSTFFDSLTWCLFGLEDHLMIDPKYQDEAEDILNTVVRENMKPNVKEVVSVSVLFVDLENKTKYRVQRTVNFTKDNSGNLYDNRSEPAGLALFSKKEEGKDWDIEKDRRVTSSVLIEKIIPEGLRQFFFFDGEKLRQHFEGDANKYLKEKVDQVSRLNDLNKCIDQLKSYNHEIMQKRRKGITDEKLRSKSEEYDYKKVQLDDLKNEFKEKNDELELNKKNRKTIDIAIQRMGANIQTIEEINKLYTQAEKAVNKNKDIKKENLANYEDLILETTPLVFLKGELKKASEIINVAIKNKQAPPPITPDYIKRLIDIDGECICGTSLKGDKNEHRQRIEELLDRVKGLGSINYSEGHLYLSDWIQKIGQFEQKLTQLNMRLSDCDSIIQENQKIMDDLATKRKESNVAELSNLQHKLELIDKEITDTETKLLIAKYEILNDETALANIKQEKDTMEKVNKSDALLTKKEEKSEKILTSLVEFRNFLINNNTVRLAEKTQKYLKELLTEKSKEIQSVEISKDYELIIKSATNPTINLRHTLSAGETQIFILSFAAALREVTGFDAPLIIDTPLGKIDEEYRLQVIDALPRLFSVTQLILLVTSSEYTDKIRGEFKKKMPGIKEIAVTRDPKNGAFNVVEALK